MTTAEPNGGNDQRVTNALIYERQGVTNKLLQEHIEQDRAIWTAMEARMQALERQGAVRETRLAAVEDDVKEHDAAIEGLKSSDRKWGGLSVVVAAIITGIGAIFKP